MNVTNSRVRPLAIEKWCIPAGAVAESPGAKARVMLGVEPVSHPGQERSLLDLDMLIAGMKVRREPVAVRHGNLDGELAGGGGIAADDGKERARREQGGHRPLQTLRLNRCLGHCGSGRNERHRDSDKDGGSYAGHSVTPGINADVLSIAGWSLWPAALFRHQPGQNQRHI